MDSVHLKRFIILAISTLVVVGISVFGLMLLNDEMHKALSNTKDNIYSVTETLSTPSAGEQDMKVEW